MNEIEDHPSVYIGQTMNEHEYFLSRFHPFSDVTKVSREDLLTRDDLVVSVQWEDPTKIMPTHEILLTLVGRSRWHGGVIVLTDGNGILADLLGQDQTQEVWKQLTTGGKVVIEMIDREGEVFSIFSVDTDRIDVTERQLELIGQPIDRTHALENLVT